MPVPNPWLVTNTYMQLMNWTRDRDPTSQEAEVHAYSKDLLALMDGLAGAITAVESGQPLPDLDLRQLVRDTATTYGAMRQALDTAAEQALAQNHTRATADWVEECMAILEEYLPKDPTHYLTPNSVQEVGHQAQLTNDPLTWFYANAAPGSVGQLSPGDYARLKADHFRKGEAPLVLRGESADSCILWTDQSRGRPAVALNKADGLELERVTLRGPFGGGDGGLVKCSDVSKQGETYDDLVWRDVVMDGGWDPITGQQQNGYTHRGVSGHDMARWIVEGGAYFGFKGEQCWYVRNTKGGIRFTRVWLGHCGRSALQLTGRYTEGGGDVPGFGDVVVELCTVRDPCLQMGGGGSALSFNGNHDGLVVLQGNDVQMGLDPAIANARDITGCVVFFAGDGSGGGRNPTKQARIVDNTFLCGPTSDRACVDLAKIAELEFGPNLLRQEANRAVLHLEYPTLELATFSPYAEVYGDVYVQGAPGSSGTTKYPDPNMDGKGYQKFLDWVNEADLESWSVE